MANKIDTRVTELATYARTFAHLARLGAQRQYGKAREYNKSRANAFAYAASVLEVTPFSLEVERTRLLPVLMTHSDAAWREAGRELYRKVERLLNTKGALNMDYIYNARKCYGVILFEDGREVFLQGEEAAALDYAVEAAATEEELERILSAYEHLATAEDN